MNALIMCVYVKLCKIITYSSVRLNVLEKLKKEKQIPVKQLQQYKITTINKNSNEVAL